MLHSDHIATVAEITRHLELEEERLNSCTPAPTAFVARGNMPPKGKGFKKGKKKSHHPSKKSEPNGNNTKKQHMVKGDKEKNMVRVKCYNCGKKGHYVRDCPEHPKTRERAST